MKPVRKIGLYKKPCGCQILVGRTGAVLAETCCEAERQAEPSRVSRQDAARNAEPTTDYVDLTPDDDIPF